MVWDPPKKLALSCLVKEWSGPLGDSGTRNRGAGVGGGGWGELRLVVGLWTGCPSTAVGRQPTVGAAQGAGVGGPKKNNKKPPPRPTDPLMWYCRTVTKGVHCTTDDPHRPSPPHSMHPPKHPPPPPHCCGQQT